MFFLCSLLSCCWPFSLHFSSSSAFLMSLFRQSSRLSCGLPSFLRHPCFFVVAIFGNHSSFILTICPAHFMLPTRQASSVPIYSLGSFILLFSTLYTSYSPYPVVLAYLLHGCCSDRATILKPWCYIAYSNPYLSAFWD